MSDLEQVQIDVQRKLGRCMLRLQQYERLLKSVLVEMNWEGPLQDLVAVREERAADIHTMSLGLLIEQFIGKRLSTPSADQEEKQVKQAESQSALAPSVHINYGFAFSSEAYKETKASLDELRNLRNELVHHFIGRFDISKVSACRDALLYLDRSYARIESGFQQLKAWAMAFDKLREEALSFVQSKTFEDAFVHGIHPDGTVAWQRSSVVEEFRSAESACQIKGWTPLSAALEFIKKKDSALTPTRFGCKTWRQLLKRSEQFDIKIIVEPLGGAGQTWYRSLAK